MRFACQSCGKAYNLPEEKIADKSNVKLKCRVCGAIVEVKRQGEVVAQILGEVDIKRGRVSEAPPSLTSLTPEDMLTSMSADDDSDDATHAIAVGDQILSEGGSADDAASALLGHVKGALAQRGAPPPPESPTAFAPTGFSSSGFNAGGFGPPGFAATPVPPPLSIPDLPRPDSPRPELPPPFPRPEPSAPPLPSAFGDSPPPLPSPQPGPSLSNGSNGSVPRFGDMMQLPREPLPRESLTRESLTREPLPGEPLPDQLPPPPLAPGAGLPVPGRSGASLPQGMMSSTGSDTGGYPAASLELAPPVAGSDITRKMLAALATGILIGFIIARLFF
jgi:zinc-ribbon domain